MKRFLSSVFRIYFRRKITRGIEVAIIPSYACNYHCSYCGRNQFGKKPSAKVKSIDEWKSYLTRLNATFRLDRTRIKTITFNGGEPTLLNYFAELSNWILDQGWFLIVLTNLSNIEPLKKIRQSTKVMIHSCYHIGQVDPKEYLKNWKELDKIHRVVCKELGDKRTLKNTHKRTQLHGLVVLDRVIESTGNITLDPNINTYLSCEGHPKANI